MDEKLAAMVSPQCLAVDEKLKTLGLSHIETIINSCPESINTPEEDSPLSWDNQLFSPPSTSHNCKVAEFYIKWNEPQVLHEFPCIKHIFVKYNTPLSTSASVEREFSRAKQIMTFDRTRLGDDLFEQLTILRAGVK